MLLRFLLQILSSILGSVLIFILKDACIVSISCYVVSKQGRVVVGSCGVPKQSNASVQAARPSPCTFGLLSVIFGVLKAFLRVGSGYSDNHRLPGM